MKKLLKLILRLFIGFFVASMGIVFMLNSNLGAGPWDVFHQGLSNNTFLTIGQASIVAGFVVVALTTVLKLKVGIGTVLNMIFIGVFTDIILFTNLIPISKNLFTGLIMLFIGMMLMSIGTYLYISCELGCGPRDGLMVALTSITKKPVNVIRRSTELGALICGYILGGKIGVGTFIIALGLGGCMKFVFEFCNFDLGVLNHKSLKDTIPFIKELLKEDNDMENIRM